MEKILVYVHLFALLFADNEITTICRLEQLKDLNTLGTKFSSSHSYPLECLLVYLVTVLSCRFYLYIKYKIDERCH